MPLAFRTIYKILGIPNEVGPSQVEPIGCMYPLRALTQ